MTMTDDALAVIAGYSFPGNVRELKNLIERLVILSPDDTIDADQVRSFLPQASVPAAGGLFRPAMPFRVLVEEAERTILQEALKHYGGQMAATARGLELERSHLYKKFRALGLRDSKKEGESADDSDNDDGAASARA
jgi:DNA-binding NtrC family response regulator